MNNKEFEITYRMASKIMHPDKVKKRNDEALIATMTEQFRKATTAKEMLTIPAGNTANTREAMSRRNMYMRRFLCTEQHLAQGGGSAADLLSKANTWDYLSRKPNTSTIQVLPRVVLLQGTCCKPSAAAASSRQKKRTWNRPFHDGKIPDSGAACVVTHVPWPTVSGPSRTYHSRLK